MGCFILVALAMAGCRRPKPSEVGEQSIRDAQPMALMQASGHASQISPHVVPEAAKGGIIQSAPSRVRK